MGGRKARAGLKRLDFIGGLAGGAEGGIPTRSTKSEPSTTAYPSDSPLLSHTEHLEFAQKNAWKIAC
jgi:hypothetical protein